MNVTKKNITNNLAHPIFNMLSQFFQRNAIYFDRLPKINWDYVYEVEIHHPTDTNKVGLGLYVLEITIDEVTIKCDRMKVITLPDYGYTIDLGYLGIGAEFGMTINDSSGDGIFQDYANTWDAALRQWKFARKTGLLD